MIGIQLSPDLRPNRILVAMLRVVIALGCVKLRHVPIDAPVGKRLEAMRKWAGLPPDHRDAGGLAVAMMKLADAIGIEEET